MVKESLSHGEESLILEGACTGESTGGDFGFRAHGLQGSHGNYLLYV